MASILLGCDNNDVSTDKKTQSVVKSALEKAGHKVKVLDVGSNNTQTAMLKSSSKGKIAIYLVNGADLQTYKDFAQGIKQGYYHVKYAYFGLQGWISPSTCSCKGAKTAKLKRAHDDESSPSYTKELVGMTTEQVCNKYKNQINYACGSSRKELADNLVAVIGGKSNTDDSKLSKKVSQGGTIREALQKLLTHWDGQVECYIRGDEVHINKVREPEDYCSCVLEEGFNVFSDSVTVTDVNPNTVNYLEVVWKNGTIVIKDEDLINRFGEVRMSVIANNEADVTKSTTKKKVKKEKDDSDEDDD